MGVIVFNGEDSGGLALTVEGYTKIAIPERVVDEYDVPGKNGLLVVDRGKYADYKQKYTCHWLFSQFGTESLKNWFVSGYKELHDSMYPNHFRLARCTRETTVDNRGGVMGRGTIVFDCRPQWFRNDGKVGSTFINGSGGTLVNPSTETALPLITAICVAGLESVIQINDDTVTFTPPAGASEGEQATVTIDCDTQNVYDTNSGANLNQYITLNTGRFPALLPGSNDIDFSGQVVSCTITPRWWDLIP